MCYFCLYIYSTPVEIRNHSQVPVPPTFFSETGSVWSSQSFLGCLASELVSVSSAPWSQTSTMTLNFFWKCLGVRLGPSCLHGLCLINWAAPQALFYYFNGSERVTLQWQNTVLIYSFMQDIEVVSIGKQKMTVGLTLFHKIETI